MSKRQVFVLVDMEELEAEVKVQAIALRARWVYFEPRFVFVPSKTAPFLPRNSNRLAKSPKE